MTLRILFQCRHYQPNAGKALSFALKSCKCSNGYLLFTVRLLLISDTGPILTPGAESAIDERIIAILESGIHFSIQKNE